MKKDPQKYLGYIDTLNSIGIALSAEKDYSRLLEKILTSAMDLTHADGGTLYLVSKKNHLNFEIFANRTLKIKPKNVSKDVVPIKPIPLYGTDGAPNLKNIASYCVIKNQTVNIADAYQTESFDFSGMRAADKKLGYHSKSFLTIPLRNHENQTIAVLQLINAMDEQTTTIIPFSEECIHLAESLASQAAIALTQQALLQAQKELFEALIQMIAKTIDAKSKYTSNHCSRVPVLALMLAEAANNSNSGIFKDFQLTADQFEELRVGAWLHDCGKLATPEYVVDKATKLSALSDRIEVIELRIEILKRDLQIAELKKKTPIAETMQTLTDALQFLKKINHGGEFLSKAEQEKIRALAKYYYYIDGKKYALLSEQDVVNLCITRGTLNDEERAIINNHVTVTQKMLAALPYPEYLKNVPEIAGNHHERMDGKGYPNGLRGDQMLLQSRMVAIADVFEALTAADRPYKAAKPLSEVLNIMNTMKENGHIDPDLFELFIREGLHIAYAKEFLRPEQIDV